MIKKGLKPTIFVINNKGYTIERCIHGKDRFVVSFIHLALISYYSTDTTMM